MKTWIPLWIVWSSQRCATFVGGDGAGNGGNGKLGGPFCELGDGVPGCWDVVDVVLRRVWRAYFSPSADCLYGVRM